MIRLREFRPGDEKSLVSLLNNRNVTRYLTTGIPSPFTEAHADWWIATGSKEGVVRAVTVDDSLIGCVGAEPGSFEAARAAEVGYWIGVPFWGQGYATAAVTELTQLVFANTQIVRLFAPVVSQNVASIRVLEKCGYHLEGISQKGCFKDGQFFDQHIYAKLHA